MAGAQVGLIAYGSADPAILEARDYLAEEGMKTDYLRLRAVPFTDAVSEFIANHQTVYVAEMNRDGQMHKLLQVEYPHLATKLHSLTKHDGLPLNAGWVKDAVLAEENHT